MTEKSSFQTRKKGYQTERQIPIGWEKKLLLESQEAWGGESFKCIFEGTFLTASEECQCVPGGKDETYAARK